MMEYLKDFLTIGAAVGLATLYLKSYLSEKGKLLASREEFQELRQNLIENTKATETIKHALQRQADAKTQGTNEILSALAEIESGLMHWQLFIYFRKENLPAGTSIEDIGRKDLIETVHLLMKYNRIISRYNIYFSPEVSELALSWGRNVYNLLYLMDAVYKASLENHSDKNICDTQKVEWISSLFNDQVLPKFNEIGSIKRELSIKLIDEFEKMASGTH